MKKIVFKNSNKLKKLNKITHPIIIKAIKKEISKIKNNKIVFSHVDKNSEDKLEEEYKRIEEEQNKERRESEDMDDSNSNSNLSVNSKNENEKSFGMFKKPRGSRYRGVSRNGNQWQVIKI